MARLDALWTVNLLAREVTRWNRACDKRLHRLISYLHHTQNYMQTCWVGDPAINCHLALFADASSAGDLVDSRSTSGNYLVLMGPNTFVPLSWMCKKQGVVSYSSSETEVVPLETAVRLEGIPALLLWEEIINVLHPIKTQPKPDVRVVRPRPGIRWRTSTSLVIPFLLLAHGLK